jgi:CBS domain-containing protein
MSPHVFEAMPPVASDPFAGGDHLERPVRELMSAGVLVVSEDASLRQVYRAMNQHGVHALLVVGRSGGTPLGWITARGLLAWLDTDDSVATARDAITERPTTVEPSAPAREALELLSQAGVTHLLVSHRPDLLPEGVVSDADLVRLGQR